MGKRSPLVLILANHDGLADGLLLILLGLATLCLVGFVVLGWTVASVRQRNVARARQLALVNGLLALGGVVAFFLVDSVDASKLLLLAAVFGAASIAAARTRPE